MCRLVLLAAVATFMGASGADAAPALFSVRPDYSVGVELASAYSLHLPQRYFLPRMGGLRLARVTGSIGPVRAGVAAAEGWLVYGGHDMAGMGGFVPLYLDVSLFRATRQTGRFYWSVPDVYLTSTFILFGTLNNQPVVKAGLACDFDYFGVGVGLEAAYVHGYVQYEGKVDEFGVGVRLRAGVANIGVGRSAVGERR